MITNSVAATYMYPPRRWLLCQYAKTCRNGFQEWIYNTGVSRCTILGVNSVVTFSLNILGYTVLGIESKATKL